MSALTKRQEVLITGFLHRFFTAFCLLAFFGLVGSTIKDYEKIGCLKMICMHSVAVFNMMLAIKGLRLYFQLFKKELV